jgi:hypothetical protein
MNMSMLEAAVASPTTIPAREVSENLKRVVSGSDQQQPTEKAGCCSPTEQASCCEPAAKVSCCGEAPAGGCGCR